MAPRLPSRSILTTRTVQATQEGPTQTPAAIASETTTIEVPLTPPAPPAAPQSVAETVPSPAPAIQPPPPPAPRVVITTHRDTATAARTYPPPEPPKPPTAAEAAIADGMRWFFAASLVCLVVAGLCVWSGHIMSGVMFGGAAVALPVLARFFSSNAAMTIAGILLGAGVAFFAAWHILKNKTPKEAQ